MICHVITQEKEEQLSPTPLSPDSSGQEKDASVSTEKKPENVVSLSGVRSTVYNCVCVLNDNNRSGQH